MNVFKFGGASVKDAPAVQNVAAIINRFPDEQLIVVVSAMGKTTNSMESVLEAWMAEETEKALKGLAERKAFHASIIRDLNLEREERLLQTLDAIFAELQMRIERNPSSNYDYEYDQMVSMGEVISTLIIHHYLQSTGIRSKWCDARRMVRTDATYREGKVDWEKTRTLVNQNIGDHFSSGEPGVVITQGFIGHTDTNHTTTLGREGSDYTGAIMAYCTGADSLTIWKDVPGMLNADPKWFEKTVRLPQISYREAIELAYYGATVIHPKTIKPLQNKEIPLHVKSFVDPDAEGTLIQSSTASDYLIPSFIFKTEQILISITPKDFSFIAEENLSHIFQIFAESRVRMNMMQNSAINFSVCIDTSEKVANLIIRLQEKYKVKYNEHLELVTIRHYDESTIERVTFGKQMLVEQRSRHTARMVMRPGP